MPTKFFQTVPVTDVLRLSSVESVDGNSLHSARNARSIHGRQRRRVLVVDDEHIIADTLATILNESGFSATTAYCAEDALKIFEAAAPDLLITDVSMPGMNGIDLAIKIRLHYPTCKILLFSGHAASAGLFDEAKRRGYDFQLLTKPVHPRDLLEHLQGAA